MQPRPCHIDSRDTPASVLQPAPLCLMSHGGQCVLVQSYKSNIYTVSNIASIFEIRLSYRNSFIFSLNLLGLCAC